MNFCNPTMLDPVTYGVSGTMHAYITDHPRSQIEDERYFGNVHTRFMGADGKVQPDLIFVTRSFTYRDERGDEQTAYERCELMVVSAERGSVRTIKYRDWISTHPEVQKAEAARANLAKARAAKAEKEAA